VRRIRGLSQINNPSGSGGVATPRPLDLHQRGAGRRGDNGEPADQPADRAGQRASGVARVRQGSSAMLIGVPKEIKVHEYRVGLTPESVRELVARGHRVMVQRDAGAGIGATDADYGSAGGEGVGSAEAGLEHA